MISFLMFLGIRMLPPISVNESCTLRYKPGSGPYGLPYIAHKHLVDYATNLVLALTAFHTLHTQTKGSLSFPPLVSLVSDSTNQITPRSETNEETFFTLSCFETINGERRIFLASLGGHFSPPGEDTHFLMRINSPQHKSTHAH